MLFDTLLEGCHFPIHWLCAPENPLGACRTVLVQRELEIDRWFET